jgi:hypothetical protein
MDITPADLQKSPTNIFSQIAIALKGGELCEPGLANLAARLAVRVRLAPVTTPEPETVQHKPSLRLSMNQSRRSAAKSSSGRESRMSGQHRDSAANTNQANHTYNEAAIGAIRPGDEEEASAAAGAIPRALTVVESSG